MRYIGDSSSDVCSSDLDRRPEKRRDIQREVCMPGVVREGAGGYRIRPVDPTSESELELAARRMRLTLNEVLGEEAGTALYSMEWLRQRVLWHLNPANCT